MEPKLRTRVGHDSLHILCFFRSIRLMNCPTNLPLPLQTEGITFGPVIALPDDYDVYDFSRGYDPGRILRVPFGVGKYDEVRPGMYAGEQFMEGQRNIHMGIDIAAPEGTPVSLFFEGVVWAFTDHDRPYDYGPTIITQHTWLNQTVFALHGHLSRESLHGLEVGQFIDRGTPFATVGSQEENGGWNPHLHFQLSLIEPETCDLPGAVSARDREWSKRIFPDPRLVLGPLYD